MSYTKKLWEQVQEIVYPDDLDHEYEMWLEQKKAEQSAYEELLSDTYKSQHND